MIPAELCAQPRWLCWRLLMRDGRPTKVPFQAMPGARLAKSNDPATWRPYEDAVRFAPKRDGGIGYALGDGWAGIDLDNCRDPETGEVAAWARTIVDLVDSYTEVSPSKTGLHILCRGMWPKGWNNRRGVIGGKKVGIEAYGEGKYFTVTGEVVRDAGIEERGAQLAELATREMVFETPRLRATIETRGTDEDVLARMRRAQNADAILRLWAGETGDHGEDRSRADQALANHLTFFCGGDVDQADRLFRRSSLMREKWDERHAADGRTYGRLTLDRAAESYRARHGETSRRNGSEPAAWTGDVLHDFADLLGEELPEPKHPVPGLIQQGLMILAGKPKVGKSYLILNVCLAVASGALALARIECPQQAVWYLALEDTRRRLQSRGRQMLAGATWPRGRFFYDTSFAKLDAGGLEKLDEKLTAHPEIRLVVIDVWKRVKPKVPKGENAYDVDYSHAVLLKTLADKHDIAIIVIHHLNKLVTDEDVDSISGSLGFAAAADGWLILRRVPRVKDAGLLRGKGRDLEDVDYALRWDRAIGTWSIVGDAEEVTATRELHETRRILADFGKPMTIAQFATAADCKYDTAKHRLFRYGASNEILSLSDGKYYVSLSPLSPVSPDGPDQEKNTGTITYEPLSPCPDPTPGTDGMQGTGGTAGTAGTQLVQNALCRYCRGYLRGTDLAMGYCRKCAESGYAITEEPF